MVDCPLGRELDRLIHIEVLGQPFDLLSSYPWDLVKPYSTDIRYAWGIFLWIRKRDRTAMVGEREVHLDQDQMGPHEIVNGDTAAHAISLAALKLARNEVGKEP